MNANSSLRVIQCPTKGAALRLFWPHEPDQPYEGVDSANAISLSRRRLDGRGSPPAGWSHDLVAPHESVPAPVGLAEHSSARRHSISLGDVERLASRSCGIPVVNKPPWDLCVASDIFHRLVEKLAARHCAHDLTDWPSPT